jgi:hypothetical protein
MTYEDRLLHQLQDIVAATPAPARRRSVRMPIAAGATATAAAAAVIVAATSGTEPAYAVQDAAGDSVSVTIKDIRDADGLQEKLRAAGVPADVRYVTDTPKCTTPPPLGKGAGPKLVRRAYPGADPAESIGKQAPPRPGGAAPHGGSMGVQVRRDHTATFTVDPDMFNEQQRLTITASGGDLQTLAIAIGGGTDTPPPLCLPDR